MSSSERLLVLIAVAENHLARQLVQRIRTQFSRLPIETLLVEDGRRALADFQSRRPDIVFMGADLPSVDGRALAQEIRKQDGAIPILYLKPQNTEAPEGTDPIKVPIIDWTEIDAKFQASIPDAWKAKFGLFEKNSILHGKLVEYGRRYRTNENTIIENRPLVCIPTFFGSVSDTVVPSAKESAVTIKEKTVYREVSSEQRRRVLLIEALILLALSMVTVAVYWADRNGASRFGFLKPVALSLSAFSFFGFFAGRVFDRFVISKLSPEK